MTYDSIADEYYDRRHITSRNFDQATEYFWSGRPTVIPSSGLMIEIGAGKGRAQEYLHVKPNTLIQTDLSNRMLRIRPRESSLGIVQCNALALPFARRSIVAAFAFLFDPYNCQAFYGELGEILSDGGLFIGTLPDFHWGLQLRKARSIPNSKTRFRKFMSERVEEHVVLDSFLAENQQITDWLAKEGFAQVIILPGYLPPYVSDISPDIDRPAKDLGISPYEMPIITIIQARKS